MEPLKRFTALLHRFYTVERVAGIPNVNRRTNGPEHTYQLAMTAWYVASSQKLPLNMEKVLMYVLAHDLVEAYAGDTFVHDKEGRETKVAREQEALERIKAEFPEFPELISILETYERREDEESRFVYALDKLVDPLNSSMTMDRPSVWQEHGISHDEHFEYKDQKIAKSKYVVPLWEALSKELKEKKDFFFPS